MYTRCFEIATEIKPHYIGFSGTYTAAVYNEEETARHAGYKKTIYKDHTGHTIWEYDPELYGLDRKYYNLDYAVVLPIRA
jgi:hypothetical protein